MLGQTLSVGEIAAAATRNQDLASRLSVAFQDQHAMPTLARFNRAHQTGCSTAQDQNVANGLRQAPA